MVYNISLYEYIIIYITTHLFGISNYPLVYLCYKYCYIFIYPKNKISGSKSKRFLSISMYLQGVLRITLAFAPIFWWRSKLVTAQLSPEMPKRTRVFLSFHLTLGIYVTSLEVLAWFITQINLFWFFYLKWQGCCYCSFVPLPFTKFLALEVAFKRWKNSSNHRICWVRS